ncbi:hypothetical protein AKJ16_DCAP15062 [Drosera capensis]
MARENWGRQGRENYSNRRGKSWQRSTHSRPPLGCQSSVPSWEKKFCATVGAVPWHKLMETKKFLHLYSDIIGWKDSACEEAFKNAKQRYWAEINGMPSDIKLPDPDIYIDEIDWNPKIDPELILELEQEPLIIDKSEQDPAIVDLGSLLDPVQPIPCTGWDDDQVQPKATGVSETVPQFIECNDHGGKGENHWDTSYVWGREGVRENGWDAKVEPDGWHHDAVKENRYDQSKDSNGWDCKNEFSANGDTRGWGRWKGDTRKQEGAGWYTSRYASPAYHQDGYKVYRGSRDGRFGNGTDYGYGQVPLVERLPSYWRW